MTGATEKIIIQIASFLNVNLSSFKQHSFMLLGSTHIEAFDRIKTLERLLSSAQRSSFSSPLEVQICQNALA